MKDETKLEENKIPSLTELTTLRDVIVDSSSLASSSLIKVRDDLDMVARIVDNDLEKLEETVINFVAAELQKKDLISKIEQAGSTVQFLLKEINFIGDTPALVTGFFSSSFSTTDEKKWTEIEDILDNVYNSETGFLKTIQDYFLYHISREQIAIFLNREEITIEEELFVRSLLVKGYLVNFNKLMLPFFALDDQIFIKFKQNRISKLKERMLRVGDEYEGSILTNGDPRIGSFENSQDREEYATLLREITDLESKASKNKSTLSETKGIIDKFTENISSYSGVADNASNVIANTLGTGRYVVSAAGFATGSATLQTIGKLGNLFGSFLPVVSTIVNTGVQLNNNRIIFNYERASRWIWLNSVVKKHLIVLQQEFTNYYVNNVLITLNNSLLTRHFTMRNSVNQAYEFQLVNSSKDLIQAAVEKIDRQYISNANVILAENDRIHKIKFDSQSLRHQEDIADKNALLSEKEVRLDQISEEILQLQNQIDANRREWNRELIDLQKSKDKLTTSITSLTQNLKDSRDLYEMEKKSHKLSQEALEESLKGDSQNAMALAYQIALGEKNTLSILLRNATEQRNDLETKFNNVSGEISDLNSNFQLEKEELEALNQKLITELASLKRLKGFDRTKLQEYETKIDELNKQWDELHTDFSVMASREVLLTAAKDRLWAQKNEEIEKCDILRAEKQALYEQLVLVRTETAGFTELQVSEINLKKENSTNKKTIANLLVIQENLKADNLNLENKLKAESTKLSDLENKSFYDKLKLLSVLTVDTSRNYLPKKIHNWDLHQTITNFETLLLASELTNSGTRLTWGLWFSALAIALILGIIRIFTYFKYGAVLSYTKLFKKQVSKVLTPAEKVPVRVNQKSIAAQKIPRQNGKFVKKPK